MGGAGVANEGNLIPNSERTPKEREELARAGGRASGESRRLRRTLRDAAYLYLSLPVSDRRRWNKIARKGIKPEDVDNQMAMIIGLIEAATKGDAKAAKVIIDLLGEKATKEQDNQGGGVILMPEVSEEQGDE